MLFSDFLPSVARPDVSRLALLDAILTDFQQAFPDLHFELRLDRRIINAQAIVLDEKPSILIYGGLGLHPSLAEASLTFVFLHEAGHHLGTGPRLPFNVTLACDCIADHWATGQGAEILLRKSGRQLQIRRAVNELDCLMNTLEEAGSPSSEKTLPGCWNRCWSQRREALGGFAPQLPIKCELML